MKKILKLFIFETMTLFGLFSSFIYAYTRPLIKWFLRKFTRLCELQRICYGSERGAERIKGIEDSLTQSRVPEIQSIVQNLNDHVNLEKGEEILKRELIPKAIEIVINVKQIKTNCHPKFSSMFSDGVQTIWNYRRLCNEIESIRATPYDRYNVEHEVKLLKLWDLLMPQQKLENRVTKQWQDIGFQVKISLRIKTRTSTNYLFFRATIQ